MVKKLTDKEKRAREVDKVVLKIRKLEKSHSEDIIKSSCAKYVSAINARKSAEDDIKDAKNRLAEAERRLR